MAVIAVLGADEPWSFGDRTRELASDLDGLGAGGGEERVAKRLGKQAGQRFGAAGAARGRKQPIAHVVLGERARQRLNGKLRVVSEVEDSARAAQVDVVASFQVPHPDPLAPSLHEVHADCLVGRRLMGREI